MGSPELASEAYKQMGFHEKYDTLILVSTKLSYVWICSAVGNGIIRYA